MQEIEWVDRAVEQTGQVPPFHVHCPLLSLGERFNVRLDRNPVETPYLSVDQDRIGHWRSLIEHTASDTRLRVGFTWAGNPKHLNDKNRSTTLENFVDLTLAHPDIQFYSVQKPTDEQRIQLADQPAIVDLGGEFNDFSDTAAALSSLDLVIGVDSAVIHLAGGLARPCWALLPYRSDWRWLLERSDSPWYPNMRLFRQPERKDWQSVFREVERELANYVQTTKLKH